MRKLNTGDAFKLMQILRVAGLKDDFATIINMAVTGAKVDVLGGKVFALLFDCLGHEKVEVMSVKLLADIAEKKPDEITQQSLQDTVSLLKDIAEQNDLRNFFKGAASLT